MLYNVRNYFFAMLAFFVPTLLANTYYIDDNGRSIDGYYNWGIDGRPLAERIMKSIMFSRDVVDIFPLNIFLSCLILALAFSVLRLFLEKGESISKWSFPIPLLIAFNIFYIEPSYYRFDSITISLAIALSVVSSVYYLKAKWDFLVTAIATASVLSLYQTSINILMLLCVANAVFLAVKQENILSVLKSLAIKGVAVALGSAIYFAVILPYYVLTTHGADHPGVNLASAVSNLSKNFSLILSIISSYASPKHGYTYMSLVFCLAIASSLFLAWKGRHKGIISYAFIILSPIVCLCLMLGVSLALDQVLYSPRVYISFGAMAYFCFAIFYICLPRNAKYLSLICLPFLTYPTVLNYAYGNAMKSQDARNIQTLTEIAEAISFSEKKVKVIFNGDYPYSAVTKNTLDSFPELARLIPNYFTNWWWSFQYMKRNGHAYDFPAGQDANYAVSALNMCADSTIKKGNDFTAYLKNDYALIDFTNSICSK